ncbi:carbonic anhydrase 1-like [Sycon ciliatum]|uniref:carbonic anhydrase 1-like n=1 Tax=Sycon ciliatum TaxID=27933 RepID=UPI0031F65BF1
MQLAIATLLSTLLVYTSNAGSGGWDHDPTSMIGPKYWGNVSAICRDGRKQSPINIVPPSTIYQPYPALNLTVPEGNAVFKFGNGGHDVSGHPVVSSGGNILLRGGPLGAAYKLHNIHIHYGNKSMPASEHSVERARTTGELHAVFYNSSFTTLSDAAADNSSSAIAVIGIRFAAGLWVNESYYHAGLQSFFENVASLTYKGNETTHSFNMSDLLRPEDIDRFYTYEGSLTTPNCQETVQWLVMEKTQYVRSTLIDAISHFRSGSTLTSKLIIGNARPVQALNGRTIYRNFQIPQSEPSIAPSTWRTGNAPASTTPVVSTTTSGVSPIAAAPVVLTTTVLVFTFATLKN